MSFYSLRLLDAGVGGHIVRHPDVTTDNGVVADGDTAQDAGIAVDSDVVLNDGMTGYVEHVPVGVFLEAFRTQRHILIERHMVSNNRRFANNNTSTMIYGKVFAYLRTRMDVNACL